MSTAYDSSLEGDEEDFVDTPEDFGDEDPGESDAQLIARARAMGWKPQHEYRGPPEKWTDYPEFLRRGEEELPVMRDQNRRLADRLGKLETEMSSLRNTVAEQRTALEEARRTATRADEAGYRRALAELKQKQREAVQAADEEAYDQIEEQLQALQQTRSEVRADPPPTPRREEPPADAAPRQANLSREVRDFIQRHASWWNDASRPHLRNTMIAYHGNVIAESNDSDNPLSTQEQLDEAYRRLAEKFPEDLEPETHVAREPAPRRPAAAPAHRPMRHTASGIAPRGGGDPFARVPADDRAQLRKQFEKARSDDPKLTGEEYVSLYENPHLDILALRRQRK